MYDENTAVPPNLSVERPNFVILYHAPDPPPARPQTTTRSPPTAPKGHQMTNPAPIPSPIKIAAVQFLNTVSLIEGLDTWTGCELIKAVPSRIGDMVRSGAADIGLASIVDAADPASNLTLIPAGMIGCEGPTLTVRLFSAVPPEQITTVHADTDSHTSVMLSDVILRERCGVRADFKPFHAQEKSGTNANTPDEAWPETVLLIGDKVVVDSPPAVRYPHQIDLGQAWNELTGLPFVYATWMCRTEDANTTRILEAAAMLERVRLRNNLRLDWLVTNQARTHRWPADLARTYIGQLLKFNPDARAQQAVTLFYEKLKAHNILNTAEPNWMPLAAPARATCP